MAIMWSKVVKTILGALLGLVALAAACVPSTDLGTEVMGREVAYVRFGSGEDVIVVAPVHDPVHGREVARIPHAPGWGISASLSPDGRWVAYVALPIWAPQPAKDISTAGEVWLLSLDTGERRLLARGADVRLAPIWSPRGDHVAFRAVEQGELVALWVGDIATGEARPWARLPSASPLGFSRDGRTLYVVQGGSLLGIGESAEMGHAPPQVPEGEVKEWSISPQGTHVAAVVYKGGRWSLWVLELASSTWMEWWQGGWDPIFRPTWGPDGRTLAIGVASSSEGHGVMVVPAEGPPRQLTAPSHGFDVPLAWAPDGVALLVAHYASYPVQQEPALGLVTAQGARATLMGGRGVIILGWTSSRGRGP
jgi:Tol biopolymer transport system component